jgi:hypothetical protein
VSVWKGFQFVCAVYSAAMSILLLITGVLKAIAGDLGTGGGVREAMSINDATWFFAWLIAVTITSLTHGRAS